MNKDRWVNLVDDPFAKGNLAAQVQWFWFDGLGGFILLMGVLFYLISKQTKLKTGILFFSVTLCCLYTTLMIVPKIEATSQAANIEFFEKRQNEDCYVQTIAFKSYVPYFYARKKPYKKAQQKIIDSIMIGGSLQPDTLSTKQMEHNFNDWVLNGDIDKPAYFSIKVQNKQMLDTLPSLIKLYEKNGFVFYKREPKI
jgi:hypothetical protein